MFLALELVSQRDLHNARIAGRGDLSESGRAAEVSSRSIQVNIVKHVEEVSADRGLAPFSERLLHRPIKIEQTGPAQQVAWRRTECARRVRREGRGVEVLGYRICTRAAAGKIGIADKIGAVLANSAQREILPGDDAERCSTAPCHGAGGFPSTCKSANQPRRSVQSWQIVNSPNGKIVRSIEIGKTIVEM